MKTGFHKRALTQFLPGDWMDEFNSGEQYYQEHFLLHAFKGNKAGIWSPLSHLLLLSQLFSLLGRKKRKFIYGPLQSPKTRLQGPLSFLLSSWTWTQYRDTINPDKNEGRTIGTTELALEKLPCLIYLASMWTQWHHVIFSLNKTNFSKI